MLPTCSDGLPENSLMKSHTVTMLKPESGYLFVLLSMSILRCYEKTPNIVSRQVTKPFVTLRGSFIMYFAYWRYGSLSSNIHSSLSKRRRETKSTFISQFLELYLPVFAKQSEKVTCIKSVFLFNKVVFTRKNVPL